MMNALGITDHKVAGKLLEMRHWHTHDYMGHQPVGVFWVVKDGKKELLKSLMGTPDMLHKTYSDGKKLIEAK